MKMQRVPFIVTEVRRRNRARNPSNRAPRYRIALVKESGSAYVTSKPITTPRQVYDAVRGLFEVSDREMFYVLCLDQKAKIIGVNLVSIGALSATVVHPREVFKAAILLNSAAIICAHNHPSGNPTPSAQDNELTTRLVAGGVILGIFLRDHVVCGEDGFFSYADQGMLGPMEAAAKGY
jgi:DNA repair protein RadC